MAAGAALGLLLAGLCLPRWGRGAEDPLPSPLPPLPCTLLEPGGAGGAPKLRPTLLRLRGAGGEQGGGSQPPPPPDDPRDPVPSFEVTDPWGTLTPAWGPPWTPPKCELSPAPPPPPPPAWAPGLAPDGRSPPELGGPWWVLMLGTPQYGVTALLLGHPAPPGAPVSATATLSVFTRTPELGAPPGPPAALHCAFAAPPGPFALEWRHQHRGAGRRLLAFAETPARRGPPAAAAADPQAQLLLGPPPAAPEGGAREVSLRLDPLRVAHHGAYVCAVALPRGRAQQLLRLRVLAPPAVTLRPRPLAVAPGATAELHCEASGFFPLDVELRWRRRAAAAGGDAGDAGVAETWTSGHRRAPDGTFGRSGGARLPPAQLGHHGDVYSCVVTHPALGAPRSVRVRVEVMGAVGPGAEDAVGLGLVAFVLCGLWRRLGPAPE